MGDRRSADDLRLRLEQVQEELQRVTALLHESQARGKDFFHFRSSSPDSVISFFFFFGYFLAEKEARATNERMKAEGAKLLEEVLIFCHLLDASSNFSSPSPADMGLVSYCT